MEKQEIINGKEMNTEPKAAKKAGSFLDNLKRQYDKIRYSKAGKWIMRGLTVAAVAGTGKVAYDKGFANGKASVVPTVVTVEKIEPGTNEETPAEKVEETAE